MSEAEHDIIVRQAHAGDLDQLHEFLLPFVNENKLLPRTFEELNLLVHSGFIALAGTDLVGFSALEIYSPKLAEIRSLAVLDGYRGQGVGKKLVQACVDLARDKKILEVMAVTSSDSFFQNCGFDFTLPGEKKALFIQTRD